MASPYTAGGILDRTDVVTGSVFIVAFAIAGIVLHLRAWYTYGYKFVWSALCFAFCVARCLAIGLRIALKDDLTNKALACITQILLSAGVAVLFVVNLQMSRRFFGQLHLRHSAPLNYIVTGACYLVDPVAVIVIVAIIQTYAASDPSILAKDRDIRIFSSIFFVIWSFLPVLIVALAFLLRQTPTPTFDVDEKVINTPTISTENGPEENSRATSSEGTVIERDLVKNTNEKTDIARPADDSRHVPVTGYGTAPPNRWELWENASVVIIPAVLLTIEQGVRVAQVYYLPKCGAPLPWYMSKASLWVFIFGLEIITIVFLGLATLPKQFTHLKALYKDSSKSTVP
ncbi:hypothetical protein CPB86DRAFT_703653 [Serendipita vermifera]|nr:hypothetical protein CPB86DRAFT_703653 [Serendipita vermifera]